MVPALATTTVSTNRTPDTGRPARFVCCSCWCPRMSSGTLRGPTCSVGDLQDAVRPALGIDHHVGDERVVPGLGHGQLHEPALGRCQGERLPAPVTCAVERALPV